MALTAFKPSSTQIARSFFLFFAAKSSCALNMKPPSPLIDTTAQSGQATCTPSAVGKPAPSVP